eukprot:maker-scaffold_9-snap-gene-11.15-mRNA-1 protein AED:0.00 eAED:0.00 QI:99/1/1/1/0/0/2/108/366
MRRNCCFTYDKRYNIEAHLRYPPYPSIQPSRLCTTEEKYILSLKKYSLKFLLSTSLFILNIFIIKALMLQLEETTPKNLQFDYFTSWTNSNPNFTPLYLEAEKFLPEDVTMRDLKLYCVFKTFGFVLNTLFLFAHLLESFSLSAVLMYSLMNQGVEIGIAQDLYTGLYPYLTECLSPNLLKRFYFTCAGMFKIPYFTLNKTFFGKPFLKRFLLVGFSLIALAPEIGFKISLFILSYLLFVSSTGYNSVILVIIISQAIIGVDDFILTQLVSPRRGVGLFLQNFVKPSKDAERPLYFPMRELTQVSSDPMFGLPVPETKNDKEINCSEIYEDLFPCLQRRRQRTESRAMYAYGLRPEEFLHPDDLFN